MNSDLAKKYRAMPNYSLSSRSAPVRVGTEEKDARPKDTRAEILSIYQSYAELYPNPKLAEEHAERERLLAQYRAMQTTDGDESTRRQDPPRRGLLGFLWGSKKVKQSNMDPAQSADTVRESDLLQYSDPAADAELNADLALCGTASALDTSCIPQEAHAFARFHLTSHKTRKNRPNAVRDSDGLVLVGLGEIAEVPRNAADTPDVKRTSDRDELLAYSKREMLHDPSYARATRVCENCLAVSWGFHDGVICIYRRIDTSDSRSAFMVGWECVGVICPSRAVLDNMHDLFASQEEEDELVLSSLLCVSDLVPFLVEAPGDSEMVASLAIARLGGFLELVPLPKEIWNVPILQSEDHQSPRRKRKRKCAHYAVGTVPNLLEGGHTVAALTTSQHHSDILSLDIFRTSVRGDTEWDETMFPDAPPAEYVLAVCGGQMGSGEVVTFWGLTTVFDDPGDPSLFSLHVTFLDGLQLGPMGTDMTIFADEPIFRRWRRARRVELRSDRESADEVPSKPNAACASVSGHLVDEPAISTLSLAVPISCMRFSHVAGDLGQPGSVLTSIVDANGALSALDCSGVVLLAIHAVSRQDYEGMYENKVPAPISIILERCVPGSSSTYRSHDNIVDAGWLASSLGPRQVSHTLLVVKESGLLETLIVGSDSVCTVIGTMDHRLSMASLCVLDDHEGSLGLAMSQTSNQDETVLQFLALCTLDLGSVVDALFQSGRFERAITVIDSFDHGKDSRLRSLWQECHQRLWERDSRIESLGHVSDVLYSAKELIRILSGETCHSETHGAVPVDALLELTKSTLKRLECVRLVSALAAGGADGITHLKAKISAGYLRLTTYLLLSRLYGVESALEIFRESFLPVPMEKLASSFASMGDIPALTLLWCRHRGELASSWLRVLSCVPLSLDPAIFCHLIPVWNAHGDTHSFCMPGHGGDIRNWERLGTFIENTYGVLPYFDEFDRMLASNESTDSPDPSDSTQRSLVATWSYDRAVGMDRAIGNLSLLASFCDCCLKCLGFTLKSHSQEIPGELNELNYMRVTADSLFLSVGGPTSSDGSFFSRVNPVNVYDLRFNNPVDVISILAGPLNGPVPIFSQFESSAQPFFEVLQSASDHETKGLFDEGLVEYCVRLVDRSSSEERENSNNLHRVQSLRNAVSFCTAVAKASRPSIRMASRMLKSTSCLTKLALRVTSCCSRVCQELTLLSSDCQFMVTMWWEIYECIPIRLSDDQGSSSLALSDQIDILFRSLVGVDILASWSIADCIPVLWELIKPNHPEPDIARLQVVSRLCVAFCHEMSFTPEAATSKGVLRLLHAFLSDVKQLRAVARYENLELSSILKEDLIKPLLHRGKFILVGEISKRMDETLLKQEQIQKLVLAYTSEGMFADSTWSSSSKGRVEAAIVCQDALLPIFPDLQVQFSVMRRYLDASHFVNSILNRNEDKLGIHPAEIRDMHPIDVVEKILSWNPSCVLEGCPEWNRPSFARTANHAIHSHYRTLRSAGSESASGNDLPPLPGSAILHLAQILGLTDEASQLVVKVRIIEHSIALSYFGAAAAVCLTLLHKTDASWETADAALLILKTVSKVLSVEVFEDAGTRLNLCTLAIKRFTGLVSIDEDSFESILWSFPILESQTSFVRPGDNEGKPEAHVGSPAEDDWGKGRPPRNPTTDFFVFRAAGIVARRMSSRPTAADIAPSSHHIHAPLLAGVTTQVHQAILADYSTDIHELFSILHLKCVSGELDDPLLLTLGRLLMFWCISNAVSIQHGNLNRSQSRANSTDFLGLATSLSLQMADKKSLSSTVDELKGIISEQAAAGMDRLSELARPGIMLPDPEIVRRLVGRGYSENGARRSAVMSANESYQSALLWAVSHTMDAHFDEPIVVIASHDGATPGSQSLDQTVIKKIQLMLDAVGRFANGDSPLASLLPARDRDTPSMWVESVGFSAPRIDNDARDAPVKPSPSSSTAPHNSPSMKLQTTGGHATKQGSIAIPQHERFPSATMQATEARPTGKLIVPTSRTRVATRSTSAIPQTTPDRPTNRSDRAALREQSATSRSTSSIVDKDERKRLIEEGRRLLEQTRANKRGEVQPPNRASRYPLRSRLAVSGSPVSSPQTETPSRRGNDDPAGTLEDDTTSDGWDFDDF